ncbi:MAG: sigma-70 family RNA polymerase sigma factor [Chloroflexi bacterium]|nr:sigma-70 family RNA polymerase sigma factor [Chloroflexota bacterium]
MAAASDERQLIRRAQQGDAAAFAELYERHYAAVFRYIYYRVADQAVAEELSSDVFVRVVAGIGSFTDMGRPILAWLYTIARNLVIDHQRRAGILNLRPLDEQAEAATPDPEEAAERGLSQQRLAAALAQLTEEQRQVIICKFVEEMDNAEVASVLDKPISAIKSLQHRALGALRRILMHQAPN